MTPVDPLTISLEEIHFLILKALLSVFFLNLLLRLPFRIRFIIVVEPVEAVHTKVLTRAEAEKGYVSGDNIEKTMKGVIDSVLLYAVPEVNFPLWYSEK